MNTTPTPEEPDHDPAGEYDKGNVAFSAHAFGIAHTRCWCAHCESEAKQKLVEAGELTRAAMFSNFMHLCPDCGSKRCPRAMNHRSSCTHGEASQAPTVTDPVPPS